MSELALQQVERHARAHGVDAEAVAQALWRGRGRADTGLPHHGLHPHPGNTAGDRPKARAGQSRHVHEIEDAEDRDRHRDSEPLDACDAELLSIAVADSVEGALGHWPGYSLTPLVKLLGIAYELGIAAIRVKNEGQRVGLAASKLSVAPKRWRVLRSRTPDEGSSES